MPLDKKTKEHRTWLERVQEQSWEPEILISGIVLFALLQIPSLIEAANAYLDVNSVLIFSNGNVDDTLAAVLLSATYWLIAGFTTHLMGRSIWAAFVGLSYVYDDGVKVEKLRYPDNYKRLIGRTADYKVLITKLEKFCSSVFAASFLIFMCTVGVFFFLGWIGLGIVIYLELGGEIWLVDDFLDPVLQIVGILYLVDFIGLGIVKRIPVVNRIYYPVYRVMSFLTLSPLYRSIYYGFVTNHKWWKVTIAMFIFSAGTVLMVSVLRQDADLFDSTELVLFNGEDMVSPVNYSNLAAGSPSKRLIFESDIIDRNVAKVLVVHSSEYEDGYILKQCGYENAIEVKNTDYDSLLFSCLENFILLELDDQFIRPKFYYTNDRTLKRRGLLTYLDLSKYSRGMHDLRLYYLMEKESGIDTVRVSDVEFFKDAAPLFAPLDTMKNKGTVPD